MIRLDNVKKTYMLGKIPVQALRGITMKVHRGEFIAIMGPSGSGKSTLMNILGALDVPTSGKVWFEGKDISKFSESELARFRGKKVGFVFQQFNLFPVMSALENVALPMIFQDVPEKQRLARAKQLLTTLGLGKRLHHKPSELSGGEQQRVAMARAFANNPDVILADEPTGNLDSKTGKQIMTFLKNLHMEEHKTIIVVTHDPIIAGYAETIVNIRDGQIVHDHILARKHLWPKNRRTGEQ
ncbi:MAG: ABC transporter ATP-binding protein [Candidatus Aenigmarchaeota archaeon]|nr:ABC transporter ATP-binding protein [Candidatus Aenigmarchaeota archaeon]